MDPAFRYDRQLGLLLPDQKPAYDGDLRLREDDHWSTRGLVGCWPMVADGGNEVFDLSGNGYHGTFGNEPTWVSGKFGSALDFDGTDDYVDLGMTPADWGTDDLTIVAWVRRDTEDPHWCSRYQYHAGGTTAIYTKAGISVVQFLAVDNGTTIINIGTPFSANSGIVAGEWAQIAFVCPRGQDGTAYKNGIAYTSYNNRICNTDAFTETANLRMGRYATSYIDCTISNVLIYKRALSAGEIADLYNNPYAMFAVPDIASLYVAAPPVGVVPQIQWLRMNTL